MDVDELPSWLVAKLRVKATSDKQLFVGVGPRADVDRYLAGVRHSTVEDVSFGPFEVDYSSQPGTKAPNRPGQQSFWLESSTGSGQQNVAWKIRNGSYRFVVRDVSHRGTTRESWCRIRRAGKRLPAVNKGRFTAARKC